MDDPGRGPRGRREPRLRDVRGDPVRRRRVQAPRERLGVQIDAAASATEEAFALGREGWFGQRLFERLRAYLGGVQVHPEVRYDEQAARDAVKSLAGEVYRSPRTPPST